jgi:hypothetical protein
MTFMLMNIKALQIRLTKLTVNSINIDKDKHTHIVNLLTKYIKIYNNICLYIFKGTFYPVFLVNKWLTLVNFS